MFKKLSAPLGRRSLSISNTSLVSPTTTQFTSESESTQVPVKILLLGSGQSGKSTILKQFGISDAHNEFKGGIFSNTVDAMRTILEMMPQLDIAADPRNERYRAMICDIPATVEINCFPGEISHAIKMLSQDPGVREAISRFSEFQLSDSAEYFFNSIERLAAENYIPTTEDILHLRVKTIGVYQKEVKFDGQTLIICDTSGERCERRKWLHCFPGTTAILFMVALNDYQKVLEEDKSVNRMNDNFALWHATVNANHDSLKSAKFILLFNKLDLFIRDFEVESFSVFFPDYISWKTSTAFTGSNEVVKALEFLRLKFLGQVHNKREVYTCKLSATDTDQFRGKHLSGYQATVYRTIFFPGVWDAVKKILL
ncbi:heterotrimeric G protein alpha subunit B [Mycena maculata]|uniref:Heterotrimeric G protein alpha subunit B n=1 Tax=Mycena maculata TaxID=230809 RepID=A0AAD7ID87_9AGAR|nr:heterotrimeric G protein alpha subunit B [Mycena maculata]